MISACVDPVPDLFIVSCVHVFSYLMSLYHYVFFKLISLYHIFHTYLGCILHERH